MGTALGVHLAAPLRYGTSCSVTCDIVQGVQSQEPRDIDNTTTLHKKHDREEANRSYMVRFIYN